MDDKTFAPRWALSLYVDLRLGLIDDQMKTPYEAEKIVAKKYGRGYALDARWACGEEPEQD